jgi:hypothetical protein
MQKFRGKANAIYNKTKEAVKYENTLFEGKKRLFMSI